MPKKNSAGLLPGLIVEGAVIGLVVTLLPKVQLGKPAVPREEAADKRPSLAPERLPPVESSSRTAVSRPQTHEPPSVDPAYVERRLDQAGQRLLSEITSHLSQQAHHLLEPPLQPARRGPPGNAYRY